MKTITAAILDPTRTPPPGARLAVFPGADLASVQGRRSAEFLEQAATYAARHHIYTVPGLYLKDNRLWLCLFDDAGQWVLEQAATHRNPSWAGDVQRGEEIRIAETPFGRVALCPDVDIYKGEVARIAALQGAEIMVSCQIIPSEDACRELILAGAWQQAQQNCLYVLNTTPFDAAIIGPCETTPDHSGFLAGPTAVRPIQAELSAEKRAAAYQSFPIFKSLNPAAYRRHLDELCR
jgi:hypothetical protein